MKSRMIIRKAEEKDKEQLLKLVNKMYGKSSPKTVKKWQKNYNKFRKLTFIVEHRGKIVAYLAWGLKPDSFYIGDLYILPRYRRKGVASKLLKTTYKIKKIFEKKYIEVDVRKKDKPALNFYTKFGFKIWKLKSKDSLKLRKK